MRKTLLCLGLSLTALTVSQSARAQFAPDHSAQYLDSRRNDELRHQTLARMLMTIGVDPQGEAPVVQDDTPLPMPVHPFHSMRSQTRSSRPGNDPYALPPRAQSRFQPRTAVPAVIQVNREIALSATGSWSNYKEKMNYDPQGTPYDRENGWNKGFQVDASTLFDLYEVKNIFVAIHFSWGEGNVNYRGSIDIPYLPGFIFPYNTRSHNMTTDTRAEIGKSFLLTDQLLFTPTIQAGYHTWNREIDGDKEAYRNFLVGFMLHLDYAVTRDLVLRGRLGWDELVGNYMDADGTNGTFHLRPRPEWIAGLDVDYRVTPSVHVIAGAQYDYLSFGGSSWLPQHGGLYAMEPSSWRNGVTMRLGAAYGF